MVKTAWQREHCLRLYVTGTSKDEQTDRQTNNITDFTQVV